MRLLTRSCPFGLALLGVAAALVAIPTAAVPAPAPGEYYFTSFTEDLVSGSVQRVRPGRQTAVSSGGQFVSPLGILNVPGEGLIVADPDALDGNGALFRVDPMTGAQTVISSGQNFRDPIGVARAQDGSYRVVDPTAAEGDGAVIQVNPNTGVQTVLTFGNLLSDPTGIAIEADGDMLVTSSSESEGSIVRIINGKFTQQPVTSGGSLESPAGIAVGSGGEIFVADPGAGGVFRVDPSTGAQTGLATSNNPFTAPWGIAFGTDGQLYVTDHQMLGTGVVRLNPGSGAFSVIGSGHLLADPGGITFADDGALLVADEEAFGGSGGIIRITPTETTTLAEGGILKSPMGIVSTPLGLFVGVADGLSGGGAAIVRVDPTTGDKTQISIGGELHTPVGITYGPDGMLYVLDSFIIPGGAQPGIIRVNPSTGVQSVVVRGGGLVFPLGIAAEANGNLLVTDDRGISGTGAGSTLRPQGSMSALRNHLAQRGKRPARNGVGPAAAAATGVILRVNPGTGAMTPLANLNGPSAVALDGNGQALVVTNDEGDPGTGLVRLDPVTGAATPVPGERHLHFAFGVAEASDGSVLASDFSFLSEPGAIQRYAVGTGAPSIDSSTHTLIWPWGIAVPSNGPDAPPVVNAPAEIRAAQDSAYGAVVNYQVQFSDDLPGATLVCTPPPGSTFPLGTTTVTCTATDSSGQRTTVQFPVTVAPPVTHYWVRVFMNGDILGEGSRRRAIGDVRNRTRTTLMGALMFSLDGGRTRVTTRQITAALVEGSRARIFGKAMVNGRGNHDFAAYLDDLGPALSGLDRVRIQLSNGIDSSGQFRGEVRVQKRP